MFDIIRITSIGSTPETLYQELETEEKESSLTREEFWNDMTTDTISEEHFNFQALYNSAEDVIVMRRFINRHTGKSTNQITNADEIERILTDFLNGKPVSDDDYSISRCRVMQIRERYYRYICRTTKSILYRSYHEFLKWVKNMK